jgi:hypothetical protein
MTMKVKKKYGEEVVVPELEAMVGPPRNRTWSDLEMARLERYYGRVRVEDLARVLGRSPASVRQKALCLGLRVERGESLETEPESDQDIH